MKKCKFCEKAATTNFVVQAAKGKQKFPCCADHEAEALQEVGKVKRGHLERIPIHEHGPQNVMGYDAINVIKILADRVNRAADKFIKDHGETKLAIIPGIDGEPDQDYEETVIDVANFIKGSLLAEEIPAMITLAQYAHDLNILLDYLEK
jgi:hypothetical protein